MPKRTDIRFAICTGIFLILSGISNSANAKIEVHDVVLNDGMYFNRNTYPNNLMACKNIDKDTVDCTCESHSSYPQLSGIKNIEIQNRINSLLYSAIKSEAYCEGEKLSKEQEQIFDLPAQIRNLDYAIVFLNKYLFSYQYSVTGCGAANCHGGHTGGTAISLTDGHQYTLKDLFLHKDNSRIRKILLKQFNKNCIGESGSPDRMKDFMEELDDIFPLNGKQPSDEINNGTEYQMALEARKSLRDETEKSISLDKNTVQINFSVWCDDYAAFSATVPSSFIHTPYIIKSLKAGNSLKNPLEYSMPEH